MCDGISFFPSSISDTSRAAGSLKRAWLRLRVCIARRRRLEALAGLDDWILRDIGVIRERDVGASPEADACEAARQFWRP